MNFWKPKSKREIVDWLFWFYSGQYSKYEIRQKDIRGWYYKLRFTNARKAVKLVEFPC
jgi:hypothetical protein